MKRHLQPGGAINLSRGKPAQLCMAAICPSLSEARELLELGARLGLPPTEVEETLMDAEGDWHQAAAVLCSAAAAQREAAAAAAAAAPGWHMQAGPATATEGDNYGWGEWAGEPVQPAVPAAAATAVEGDNYGEWGWQVTTWAQKCQQTAA